MTPATTQTGLTVRTFLLGSGPEDDTTRIRQLLSENDVMGRCGKDLTRLTQQGREAAEEQLASVTAGLLDRDLGDLLIYSWRTRERLVQAALETRQIPGRQDVVQLGTHRITSTYNPAVELLVDNVRVHTFRFHLTVIFDIDEAVLVIRDGLLAALKAGDGTVTGTLTLEMPGGDVDLAKQQQKINLHLIVNIGIPLLPADPSYRPTPAPGTPPSTAA
jgi:hypothetical protein